MNNDWSKDSTRTMRATRKNKEGNIVEIPVDGSGYNWKGDIEHMAEIGVAVNKYSKLYKIPQEVIWATIKTESTYNPIGMPPPTKGNPNPSATGLMQVINAAFADVVARQDVPKDTNRKTIDGGIHAGVAYLKELSTKGGMEFFEGRADQWDAVMAKYKQGPRVFNDMDRDGTLSDWRNTVNDDARSYVSIINSHMAEGKRMIVDTNELIKKDPRFKAVVTTTPVDTPAVKKDKLTGSSDIYGYDPKITGGENSKDKTNVANIDWKQIAMMADQAGLRLTGKANNRIEDILNQTVGYFSAQAPWNATIASNIESELSIADDKTTNDVMIAASAISVGAKDAAMLLARADKGTMVNTIKQSKYPINKEIVSNPSKYTHAQVVAASQAIATSFNEYKLNEKMQSVANMILTASQSYTTGVFDDGNQLAAVIKRLNVNSGKSAGYANNFKAQNAKNYIETYQNLDDDDKERLETSLGGKEKLNAMLSKQFQILGSSTVLKK